MKTSTVLLRKELVINYGHQGTRKLSQESVGFVSDFSNVSYVLLTMLILFLLYLLSVVLEFELRAFFLLGSCSAT
jgi:hypothetical protein